MTPENDESLRESQEALERRDLAPDGDEVADLKEMGHAITLIREGRGVTREDLAPECEMTLAELKKIEGGEIHALWGDLRRIAIGLGMPLPELFTQAEEHAPRLRGERRRRRSGKA